MNVFTSCAADLAKRICFGETILLIGPPETASIVVALAQILLDPSYRSLSGFITLFLKEMRPWSARHLPLEGEPWPEAFIFMSCTASISRKNLGAFSFSTAIFIDLFQKVHEFHLRYYPNDCLANLLESFQPLLNGSSSAPPADSTPVHVSCSPWVDYLLRDHLGLIEASSKLNEVKFDAHKQVSRNLVLLSETPLSPTFSTLHLYDGQVWTIPLSYGTLTALTTLALDSNRFHCIPEVVAQLTSLTSLSISRNALTNLPNLTPLRKLQTFIATRNAITQIAELPPSLTSLHLDSNALRHVPDHFTSLNQLKTLLLAQNMISFVPAATLTSMSVLQKLMLSENQLSILPTLLPASLTDLDVGKNKLSGLTSAVWNLTNLVSLGISYNGSFKELPSELGNLKLLKHLSARRLDLETLPDTLQHCRSLEVLSLSKNKLSDIPLWFYRFQSLHTLDLADNSLSRITPVFGQVTSLRSLDLSKNRISQLPLPLGLLANSLEAINLSDNPLPPEHLQSAKHTPSDFLTGLQTVLKEELHLRRANVMLVGPSRSGKSALFNSLNEIWDEVPSGVDWLLPAPPPSIHKSPPLGLDSSIRLISAGGKDKVSFLSKTNMTPSGSFRLKKEKTAQGSSFDSPPTQVKRNSASAGTIPAENRRTTLNDLVPRSKKDERAVFTLWDFSGDEIYRPIHRWYLSNAAVYLIVSKLNETSFESHVEHWFNTILAQVQSPYVVVVGSYGDERSAQDGGFKQAQNQLETMVTKLSTRVQNCAVRGLILSSTSSISDVVQLAGVVQQLASSLPSFGRKVPFSFVFFEQLLKDHSNSLEQPIVPAQTLLNLADACGLRSLKEVKACMRLLHDLNSVFHFDDVASLRDVVFLDPLWLSSVVASVFSSSTSVKNGILSRWGFETIFKQFSPTIRPQLRSLLIKLDVAHKIEGNAASISSLIQVLASNTNKISVIDFGKKKSLNKLLEVIEADFVEPMPNKVSTGDSSELDDSLLISALLPPTPPNFLVRRVWMFPPQKGVFHFDRIFYFEFLPTGFFPNLLVETLRYATGLVALWQHGLLALLEHQSHLAYVFLRQYPCRIQDMHKIDMLDSGQPNTVKIEVRSTSEESARFIFTWLMDMAAEVMDQFKRVSLQYFVQNPLSFSQAYSISGFIVISIDQIEEAVLQGRKGIISSASGERDLSYDTLCPDITIASYKGPRVTLSDLAVGTALGEGGFAKVLKGTYQGEPVAVKLLKVPKDASKREIMKWRVDFRREILAQSTFVHPNIAAVKAICLNPVAMALEYCGSGQLFKLLHSEHFSFGWNFLLQIALDVGGALGYMQSLSPPWAHLDVKTPNILLKSLNPTDSVCAQLTDFGTSVAVEEPLTVRVVDNPTWLAPEILKGLPYTEKVDTYGFGLLLWELVTRQIPFSDVRWIGELQEEVIAGKRPPIPSSCPPAYQALITSCWAANPDIRPKLSSVITGLSMLVPSAKRLDHQLPIPAASLVPAEFASPDLAEQPANPLTEIETFLIWIDHVTLGGNNDQVGIMMRLNPDTRFISVPSLADFMAWFEKEGSLYQGKIKVVTNAYRPDDGGSHAADNVIRLIGSDPRMSSIPICVFCADPKPMDHLRKKATITSDPGVLKDFISGGKK